MTRTNVVLDEKLVESALRLTKMKSRRSLIDYALRELVRHEAQKNLLKFKGKIHWEGNLDAWRKGKSE